MTIFDSGYSSLDYQPVRPPGRLWSLARSEFGRIFRTKKGLLLFIACVVYVVVLLVCVFWAFSPQGATMPLDEISKRLSPFHRKFYLGYSTEQGFLAFVILTAVISVRSIAADRAANALEIYWTRGITPWGYFLGKWMGSFLLLCAVFVAGPVVAWLYGLISASDATFFKTTIEFIPLVVLAMVLKCLVLSFLAVAFSGLASSPNIVTFLWLVMILGSAAVVGIIQQIARVQRRNNPGDVSEAFDWYDALSPWDAIVYIEGHIAGVTTSTAVYPVWIAWLSLAILCGFLLLRLRKKLRTSEAIA